MCETEVGRTFSVKAQQLWNNLPLGIRQPTCFKSRLQTHFIIWLFPRCLISMCVCNFSVSMFLKNFVNLFLKSVI